MAAVAADVALFLAASCIKSLWYEVKVCWDGTGAFEIAAFRFCFFFFKIFFFPFNEEFAVKLEADARLESSVSALEIPADHAVLY